LTCPIEQASVQRISCGDPSPPSTQSPAPWVHASRPSPSGHAAKHPSPSDVGFRPRPHDGTRGGLRPLEARAGFVRCECCASAPRSAAAKRQRLREPLQLRTHRAVIPLPETSRPASLGIWHARGPLRRADARVSESVRCAGSLGEYAKPRAHRLGRGPGRPGDHRAPLSSEPTAERVSTTASSCDQRQAAARLR
jgi:hypothetical protein